MSDKKFNPSNAKRLESATRLQWNDPVQIVAESHIQPGSRVAEIGCGTGWFTFELEKAVRPRGMIYALDVQPAMLQILQTKRRNWERILILPSSENSFELDDGEVDVVFHANALHECEDQLAHLKEVKRVLKEGGRTIVVEWRKTEEENPLGPPNDHRLGAATIKKLLEDAGFDVQSQKNFGPSHCITQATKR